MIHTNQDGTACKRSCDQERFYYQEEDMNNRVEQVRQEALQAIAAVTMENARNFNEGLPYGMSEVK